MLYKDWQAAKGKDIVDANRTEQAVRNLKHVNLKNLSYEELLDLFQTISVLNPEYGKILTKIFDKKFSTQLAVQAFMELCNRQEVVEGKFKMDDTQKTPLKTQKKSLARTQQKQLENQKEDQFTF